MPYTFEKINPSTPDGFAYRAGDAATEVAIETAERALSRSLSGLFIAVERLKSFPQDAYVRKGSTGEIVLVRHFIDEIEAFRESSSLNYIDILIGDYEPSED